MQVRGAPLIGAAAAYGVCLAMLADASDEALDRAYDVLLATRPTAVNLRWALDVMREHLRNRPRGERVAAAYRARRRDLRRGRRDQRSDRRARRGAARRHRGEERRRPLNVLTHCNAGWLAGGRLGHGAGADLQGARSRIAAPCLGRRDAAAQSGHEPHRLGARADGRRAHRHRRQCRRPSDAARPGRRCHRRQRPHHRARRRLQQDRHVSEGAGGKDNGVPFYVALPSSSIDWTIEDGVTKSRSSSAAARNCRASTAALADGRIVEIDIAPEGSAMANYAFDVTPARLVTGIITERGVCAASAAGLRALYPEARGQACGDMRNLWSDRGRPRGRQDLARAGRQRGRCALRLHDAAARRRAAPGAARRRQHLGEDHAAREDRRGGRGALRQGLRLGHGDDRAARPAGGAAQAAAALAALRC